MGMEKITNKEQIFALIAQKGANSIKNASLDLRNDKDVMLAAIKKGVDSVRFGSIDLLHNKDFIYEAFKISPGVLKYVSKEIKEDNAFMTKLIEVSGMALKYASESLKTNEDIISLARKTHINIGETTDTKTELQRLEARAKEQTTMDEYRYILERIKTLKKKNK
jgi:DhnA family fructose-bisphosphate aldolase class Ia